MVTDMLSYYLRRNWLTLLATAIVINFALFAVYVWIVAFRNGLVLGDYAVMVTINSIGEAYPELILLLLCYYILIFAAQQQWNTFARENRLFWKRYFRSRGIKQPVRWL